MAPSTESRIPCAMIFLRLSPLRVGTFSAATQSKRECSRGCQVRRARRGTPGQSGTQGAPPEVRLAGHETPGQANAHENVQETNPRSLWLRSRRSQGQAPQQLLRAVSGSQEWPVLPVSISNAEVVAQVCFVQRAMIDVATGDFHCPSGCICVNVCKANGHVRPLGQWLPG